MADPVSWIMIEAGWEVVAADGSPVGRVDEVVGDENADIFNGLKIITGLLGSPKYVPSEQVGEIVEGTVHLTLSSDALAGLDDHTDPPAHLLPG
jgi:hypothetical protein